MTHGPESGLEGGEAKEGAPSSLGNEEPVRDRRSPPAGTPADLVVPKGRKDIKATPTRVGLQSAPKVLDPHPLQLPLGQRELAIQALRYAVQDRQDARHRRILQEVAGLPPERGPHSQDRFLRAQVQKLTLELEEQKERAQLERKRLEEQLLQTQTSLQQRESELQALHKSCLVKLAHSSWVGRMLRSSTGSVEVVTAETLVDPSDSSENDEASPAREGFRLEHVDWNTIAQRYPNLLANIKSNSDYKHPRPRTPPRPPGDSLPEECGLESSGRQHRLKSVEWGSGPFVGPDNSWGADADPPSWQPEERSGGQKATGHPIRSPGHISFQNIPPPDRSLRRDSDAEPEGPPEQEVSPDSCGTHSDQPGQAADADHGPSVHPWSETSSCLKIVAVSLSKGFVRILNESAEETADLGGSTLQQLQGDFPVRTYRFPPHTLLEPQHHVTVWGEGPGCTRKQPGPSSVGRKPAHFHPSPSFVTLLLSPKGEVLSKYQPLLCPAPALRIFADTDLSIDRFLLSEAQPRADARQQRRPPRLSRKRRRREARAQSRRPRPPTGWLQPSRFCRPSRTQGLPPCLATSKLSSLQEAPAPPERVETDDARVLLPAITEDGPSLTVYRYKMEPTVRVCRKSVDRGCPMVALSVQSRANSRFRLPGCPPITVDACRRV
ncbi:lamin tail domain-containing protein 2 [Phyllostomus hastatus]|uniref:lamin tail domain-containing protein 2 n=1 Tax=Phyllostomus hastatus TaxID=9423 RepID=UPI001E684DDE|nr:lamin tail domain-containing protein 2 [Phyllostomus hastatus]